MAFSSPPPYLFACFPLQEYFVNKDTGFPLASGVVEFFSDAAYTIPKDVYQQNQTGTLSNPTYTYVNLGAKLVLSSVGTFVDNNGTDIIPFLYPYEGVPPQDSTQSPQGNVELYFIRVWSKDPSIYNDAVLQFTRQGWPPNITTSSNLIDNFESTQNVYTNPQFNVVNFTPDPVTGKLTISVTPGGVSVSIAPGWTLSGNTASAGDIRVRQIELVAGALTEPSYAIEIDSDITITDLKLTQRLNQSPRMFFNTYLNAFILAKCTQNISVNVTTTYVPSSGTSKLILQGATTDNGEFTELSGVANSSVLIDGNINQNPPSTGYVDLVTAFDAGRIMQFTCFQAITVQNIQSLVPYIQQSTPQQTNAQFWYYKPQLEYKPIPSYTLGWNWPINPCQELGTTVAVASNTPGFSRYVADETIAFQSVDSSFSAAFGSTGMVVTNAIDSSFAIIKYFEGNLARQILSTPLSVQLKAGGASASTVAVNANVSIWWTTNATLPNMKSPNFYSLVSAVDNTTGVATVGGGAPHGDWTELPRSNLGRATVNLKTDNPAVTSFSGWQEADNTPSTTATYCAIVISVSKLEATVPCTFEYCTLNAGDIATRPQATSFGENLAALQQFYEKSYNLASLPGSVIWPSIQPGSFEFATTGTSTSIIGGFCSYKTAKRKSPSTTTGATTQNLSVYSIKNANTGSVITEVFGLGTDRPVTSIKSGITGFGISYNSTSSTLTSSNAFAWKADARLGIEL